jgi:hypothetical protein
MRNISALPPFARGMNAPWLPFSRSVTIAALLVSIILAVASILLVVVVPFGALLANRNLVQRNEDRHVSGLPVVGSLVGFLAIALAPIGTARERIVWSWVPPRARRPPSVSSRFFGP